MAGPSARCGRPRSSRRRTSGRSETMARPSRAHQGPVDRAISRRASTWCSCSPERRAGAPDEAAEDVARGRQHRGEDVPLPRLHGLDGVAPARRRHEQSIPRAGGVALGEDVPGEVGAEQLDEPRPGMLRGRPPRRRPMPRSDGPPASRGGSGPASRGPDEWHDPGRAAEARAPRHSPATGSSAAMRGRRSAGIRSRTAAGEPQVQAGSMPNGSARPLNSRFAPLPTSPRTHGLTIFAWPRRCERVGQDPGRRRGHPGERRRRLTGGDVQRGDGRLGPGAVGGLGRAGDGAPPVAPGRHPPEQPRRHPGASGRAISRPPAGTGRPRSRAGRTPAG